MKAAADLTLAFLPFEKAFYDQHQVPCAFVGHTMADAIPLENDQVPARLALGLDVDKPVLAVLPGSRHAEISMLAPVFLQTCRQLIAQFPTLQFVVPCVNARRRAEFETILAADGAGLPVSVIDGQARLAMTAADVILLSSGTATLEAMLVNRPMVVAYKVKPLTFWIGKKLVKIRMFSLPNLLAGKMIVPEFIQENCTSAQLSQSVSHYLQSDNSELSQTFLHLHQKIRCNADVQAARAVAELIQRS
jgi:lipid-A-disaccharide synthase